VICHACGEDNVAGGVCRSCGSPLGRVCPACTFENVPESRFCGGCGKVLEEAQAEDALGERRQITCLFIDLVGSTELSQRLDPEDLRDLLAAYQAVCSDAVNVHGGHIAQFLGDGIVIYFGYPRSHEDDAQRAVRCALDILEEIESLNDQRDAEEPILIRLGAHTGRVVVGPVGAGDRFDRIALGDTPNIAARLEGEAGVGAVAISNTTWQLLGGAFTGRSLGNRTLKGVAEPLEIWTVEGRTRLTDRVDLETSPSPLVARDAEMARLTSIIDESWTSVTSRFVLLRGEAGVGKSRLVRVLRERYGGDDQTILMTRSTPESQNVPFAPIRDLLHSRLGLAEAEDPIATIESLLDERQIKDDSTVAYLAGLLNVPLPDRVVPPADTPARQRIRTMELLVQLLTTLAEGSPTLLLVEDLHWADASTLEWFERLISASPNIPLTVVFAARPALEVVWISDSRVEAIDLKSLDVDAITSLAESVARGKALPRAVLREIIERSEGVPLFVEELTRSVLESGQLIERSATWEATGATDEGFIPSSVDSSLTARIDSIGGSRATAQLAAVIGREFDLQFLTSVSARPGSTVENDVKTMVNAGLAMYTEDDPNRVRFKHALIRDAAYNTLLRTARRAYHHRIAEGYAASNTAISPDVLAHHLYEAGDLAEAAPFWEAAAQTDLATNSLSEAARHLARAIECLQQLEANVDVKTRELELQIQIWPLWAATEGWGSSNLEAACKSGLTLATELERYDLLYVPLWGLYSVYFLRGEMGQAMETAREVHKMAHASGVQMLKLTGEHALAFAHLYRGELDDALAATERGLALYEFDQEREIANLFQLSSTVSLLGIRADVRYLQGAITAADEDLRSMIQLARDLDHPPSLAAGLAYTLHRGALRFPAHDRVHHLQPVLDELLALTADEGSLLWQAVAHLFRVAATVTTAEEAEVEMGRAWEIFAQTGSLLTEVNVRIMWAEARLRLGDRDGAARDLDLAEEAMTTREEGLLAPGIWRIRGKIAAAEDRVSEAAAAFDRSLDLADQQNAVMLRLRILVDRYESAIDEHRDSLVEAIGVALTRIDGGDDEPEILLAGRICTDHHATND